MPVHAFDRLKTGLSASNDSSTTNYELFRQSYIDAVADQDFVNYVNSRFPSLADYIDNFDPDANFSASSQSMFRPFLYDSVTALGLSMCQAGGNSTFFTGKEIFSEFREMDFEGVSGKVTIVPETGSRDYKTIPYVLWNVLVNSDAEGNAVIEFVPSRLPITGNVFVYADGTRVPPSPLPEVDVDNNYIGQSARIAGLLLMSVALLSAIIFLLWLLYYRKESVVQSAQPLFLLMLVFGSIIMASSIYPLSLDDESTDGVSSAGLDRTCMTAPWLYSIGFSMSFSALFAKMRGVRQVRLLRVNALESLLR
jgi:hypothetical protein